MNYQTIKLEISNQIALVTLNRPEVKNAFNEIMIAELTECFKEITKNEKIRLVKILGAGDCFCSGGDLNWMKRSATLTAEENNYDAKLLTEMFLLINEMKIPVIAGIQKYALGGGVGLVSVCDYVIAEKKCQFSLSEVKVGLIPACIGPFVLAKMGESFARAYFLSAKRFSAHEAYHANLIHNVKETFEDVVDEMDQISQMILETSPHAVATAKLFLRQLKGKALAEQNHIAHQTLADIRVSNEAQEGIKAFLEKRKPQWQ